jgi:hypothetical protein
LMGLRIASVITFLLCAKGCCVELRGMYYAVLPPLNEPNVMGSL